MQLLACWVSLLLTAKLMSDVYAFDHYETWEVANRTDLKCPKVWCEEKFPRGVGICCACTAKPSWELDGTLNQLSIEYFRRNGKAIIIGENVLSALVHTHGMLKELPTNLCEFWFIVKLVLRHNYLTSLIGVACLFNLDTLDVSYNTIHHIANDTFMNMPMLRVLNITDNELSSLDPFTVANAKLNLFFLDLSNNNLTVLDISNLIPENFFCKYNYSSNQIEDFVNHGNFQIDINKIYEGGMVDLLENNFNEFFDHRELGINDIVTVGKLLKFSFLFSDASMKCNCIMQPFLKLSEETIKRLWLNYYNITCTGPPDLESMTAVDIVREDRLDQLVCDLNETEKCPRYCYCFDQPNKNRTVVDCSSRGLEDMPAYLPERYNIELNIRNNSIRKFYYEKHLINMTTIDLSQNLLQDISKAAIVTLKKFLLVNLTTNKLTHLDRDVQMLHPCSTHFGQISIQCDCSSLWIKNWLQNKNNHLCLDKTNITCLSKSGLIPALKIHWDDVCEDQTNLFEILTSVFCIISSIAMIIFGTLYIYRYELFILRRKCFPKIFSKVLDIVRYDAYISFCENNRRISQWVLRNLDQQLCLRGYKTFIPCRDIMAGTALEEEISIGVASSKHFIIILCESYMSEDSPHNSVEWKYIWHSFRQNPSKSIIIINFGLLDVSAVVNSKMKAFLRLGLELDFANRKRSLLKDVICRLGPPMRVKRRQDTNAKTKFTSTTLTQGHKSRKMDSDNIHQDYVTIKV